MDDNPYRSPETEGAPVVRQGVSPPVRYVVMVFLASLSAILSAWGGVMALSYSVNRGMLFLRVVGVICCVGLALFCASAWNRRR